MVNEDLAMNVCVIMTCFNRKEKTVNCIRSIADNNPDHLFEFIVTDDNSTDGTVDALQKLPYKIIVLQGTGSLFWTGGMRNSIDYFFNHENHQYDYVLWVNDDVIFFDRTISNLICQHGRRDDTVVVGATCDYGGEITYGLQTQLNRLIENTNQLQDISLSEEIQGDTFNANCVLIPPRIMKIAGNLDSHYTHGLGDFDYGYRLTRMGYRIVSSMEYVGICEKNSLKGSWLDTSLSRKERFKMKESPKGSPFRELFYFYKKNYSLRYAIIRSIFPYAKILMGR